MFPGVSAIHRPDNGPIEILHRTAHLAVLDKPPNWSMLADRTGGPCLWDTLPDLLGCKPYLVHRLDKGTSGVLLVALDQQSQSALTRAFNRREVRKFYLAWVVGPVDADGTLTIDLPLKPGRKSRYRVAGQRSAIVRGDRGWAITAAEPEGHASLTRLRVLVRTEARSLLLLQPLTGRTHQLRVHLSWIGHPILGDSLYGKPGTPEQAAARLQLHCHRLVVPAWGSFSARPGLDWLPREDRSASTRR